MANECFITFKDRVPSDGDLRNIALDFVGPEIGKINEEHTKEGYFILGIKGTPSFPLKGLAGIRDRPFPYEERWIEFDRVSEKCLIVQTRQTDEFTSTLSRSIAQCISRYYGAEYDPGG